MNNVKDYNTQIEVQNQNNLRELEIDYINDKIAQLSGASSWELRPLLLYVTKLSKNKVLL